MICFVLAGGSSDRLWPLSRKDYPKQFMEIKEGRSMFQDTILRNIPFCDEFVILTNQRYENVVRGQMQAFQALKYRVILEEVSLQTAPAVIVCAQTCAADDELLIVPTDSLIEGDYTASISKLKEAVKADKFAAITCKPTAFGEGYNYVSTGKNISFGVRPSKFCLWDTGIWGAKAGVLLNTLDRALVEKCAKIGVRNNVIEREGTEQINSVSLIKVVAAKNACLIPAAFEWTRITDISSFYHYYDKAAKNNQNTISHNSRGVEIVNMVDDRLIVANGLRNVVIVNTRDAIYVTNSTKEADIKGITNSYYASKKQYFDIQPKKYENWGVEELIGSADQCKVKLITVYPRESYEYRTKKNVVANFFITQGKARLETERADYDYSYNQNITILDPGVYHITNTGKNELVFVFTEKNARSKIRPGKLDYLVGMAPVFKDNLWGGTKIRDVLGKDVGDMDVIAESWELSAHHDGQSRISTGFFKGKTLGEYIDFIGWDKLGWKTQNYEKFPIMIKFIDAKQNLSIQVHPADEYAMTVEGEYGKNEMWYVLDADEDACIYVGFNKNVTPEELRRRIADNTLMQVLNKIPVKKGETYFLKAGTVHAIGAGCFICEIQQSSNVTYRLYDYGRRDKNGNLRQLSVDKALDVLDMKAYVPKMPEQYEAIMRPEYVKTLLGQCKYFTVYKYFIDGECVIPASEASFQAFVVLEGKASVSDGSNTYKTSFGETWFCTSREQITIKGKCRVLAVNI